MKTYRLREDKSLEETTGTVQDMRESFRANRHVGKAEWHLADFTTLVLSTVFLVIDHDGDLFETMVHIKDGSFGESQVRYPSWEKALAAHEQLSSALDAAILPSMTAGDALAAADRILETP